MAARHSSRAGLVPAVAYYRMSSDRQEASIADQREAVQRYAADHGYRIIREYIDEGISGDATERRTQFQAMHKAACNGRDFEAILVWDQDRFGRFDSMEAGYWVHPLRLAGVKLVSVGDGVVSWDDFTGRVIYSIKAEGKHQFLRDLSRNTLRGKLAAAKQGYWLSKPPYGYRLASDGGGTGSRKRCRLVLGDESEVATVRRMYSLYLAGQSIRSIAHLLTQERAGGAAWSTTTIQSILTSQTYVGTYRWNTARRGKYHSVAGGEVAKQGQRGATTPGDWIVIEDNHPAIIDRQTFNKVQAALAERKRMTTPHKGGGGFMLTGLCRCGKCGGAMVGHAERGSPRYLCLRHERTGACDRNAVGQSELLVNIVAALQDKLIAPHCVERLKAALRKQVAAKVETVDCAALERQLTTIEGKLAKAKRRLVEVDADLLDVVQGEVRRLLGEQEQLQAAVKAANTPQKMLFADVVQTVDAAIARLGQLRDAVQDCDPVKVRELLRQAIDHVEVHAVGARHGKRQLFRLQRGSIYLRGHDLHKLFATSASRGS